MRNTTKGVLDLLDQEDGDEDEDNKERIFSQSDIDHLLSEHPLTRHAVWDSISGVSHCVFAEDTTVTSAHMEWDLGWFFLLRIPAENTQEEKEYALWCHILYLHVWRHTGVWVTIRNFGAMQYLEVLARGIAGNPPLSYRSLVRGTEYWNSRCQFCFEVYDDRHIATIRERS